ncbi:MAG: PQQ-dependent sugar dehydrogenase [Boseongicola sp.]|nr:PQQ-dependent sugar dehydrogenase [Boseongicola sp.]
MPSLQQISNSSVFLLSVFLVASINANEDFEVGEGLQVTLSSSEPDIVSLSNIDIDHRGRVWACDVVNYRPNRGKRAEGDRILIMEDLDGDGKMDSHKVFYQGTEVDAAMGLCVLSDRVIVSVTPKVWVFYDDDGDDRADRRELLFSGDGVEQHDHSYHSLVFGPDGNMYWNFGNTGKNLRGADGNVLKDIHGRLVEDKGKPFWGGMVFRCQLDGSRLEVLGHNFRNNYEVSVDSFGSLWQSDNDDDGNRATRINFVMEGGNYGYLDELTGEGWRKERPGMHEDVSLRHWHLNDPGVVPNVVQTGAGAPTGITVYEGRLLPRVYWDQVVHCESGVNVVRAYPTKESGAGYAGQSLALMKSRKDQSFRPVDVAVAPDGSLFVSDWYDSVVGGFQQRDIVKGRLYRIAPKGARYVPEKLAYDSPAAAVSALKNPNYCVRYKAWQVLHGMGVTAEKALLDLYQSENQRHRARALWLLGRMAGREEHYVRLAAGDANPDIRVTALRLAVQVGASLPTLIDRLAEDSSAKVRRECAVCLRLVKGPVKAQLWRKLAVTHEAGDRWSLEARGIAAADDWAACLDARVKEVGNEWNNADGLEIVWRSRATRSAELIAKILMDPGTEEGDRPRYFRALDFQPAAQKEAALESILFGTD